MASAQADTGATPITSGTPADIAWVQIEAQPSLTRAQTSIRNYASRLPDVNGFALGGGWYGVALGPYTRRDAERVLRVYRADGDIPRDAYIAFSSGFRQQFWPVGANLLNLPKPAVDATTETTTEVTTDTAATDTQPAMQEITIAPAVIPEDETPREARASEAALSRDERKNLQVALKWSGVYQGAIDGAFGRGTRGSMARWQDANAYKPTGILTTKQRVALFDQYNAVLNGLDLQTVQDQTTGIQMLLPLGAVKFAKYTPPFAHFNATGDIDARVLLISQKGDQSTLFGLYDIMQTLDIVPEAGPRERKKSSFTLIGEGATTISHTQVSLKNGEIKGFTLIWPAGDEERRTRLLSEMQGSFARIDGTMDAAAGDDEQSIDLVSGLEIRRPIMARSGFYIDGRGTVVTTSQAVQSCGRITVDNIYEAEILASDDASKIAILRPKETLAPTGIAAFSQVTPRLQSEIAVSGFSYEGVLGAPTLTYGTLSDIKGLQGEKRLKRLALNVLAGDAGGPVFDAGGAVMGMLLPNDTGARKLPQEVSFAADATAITALLEQAGIVPTGAQPQGRIAPEDLIKQAIDMTVLVSCWE